MKKSELEAEIWKINDELVKAGIKPWQYPSTADAVAELVKRYNNAQQSVQPTLPTHCAECGCSIVDAHLPTCSYWKRQSG